MPIIPLYLPVFHIFSLIHNLPSKLNLNFRHFEILNYFARLGDMGWPFLVNLIFCQGALMIFRKNQYLRFLVNIQRMIHRSAFEFDPVMYIP